MSALAAAWFVVVAVFVAAYAVLDGFDLGIATLYTVMGRDEEQRATLHDSVSPFWDGNEVWIILIGGLLFAVFPPVYATVLSGFYLVFVLILLGLILRAAALGLYYTGAPDSRRWVMAFAGGSTLAGFLLGLVAGNLIRGVPLSPEGEFAGGLGSLFNPFAILIGILGVLVFANQGAAWAAFKTAGNAHRVSRTTRWWTGWVVLAIFAGATLAALFAAPSHAETLARRPLGWVVIAAVVLGIASQEFWGRRGRDRAAFAGASATVLGMVGIWAVGAFPTLVPASNGNSSLTVANSAAAHDSLVAMAVVAAIGIPLVAVSVFLVYRVFRGRATRSGEGYQRQ